MPMQTGNKFIHSPNKKGRSCGLFLFGQNYKPNGVHVD